jgi:hypothetical protein
MKTLTIFGLCGILLTSFSVAHAIVSKDESIVGLKDLASHSFQGNESQQLPQIGAGQDLCFSRSHQQLPDEAGCTPEIWLDASWLPIAARIDPPQIHSDNLG